MSARHVQGEWDRESYFAEMRRKHGAELEQIAKTLYDWADANLPEIRWGQGKTDATFYAALRGKTIFGVETRDEGIVYLRLENIVSLMPFREGKKRSELFQRIEAIRRSRTPARYAFLPVAMDTLKGRQAMQEFCVLLQWIAQEIQASR